MTKKYFSKRFSRYKSIKFAILHHTADFEREKNEHKNAFLKKDVFAELTVGKRS